MTILKTLAEVTAALKNPADLRGFGNHGNDRLRLAEKLGGPFYADMAKELRDAEAEFGDAPMPELKYSHIARVREQGFENDYESPSFSRRKRLLVYAALSIIYPGEKRHIKNLIDAVWSVCGELAWTMTPAGHIIGNNFVNYNAQMFSDRKFSPRKRHPKQFVDLFAAETGFALAEILGFFGDEIPAQVYDRAANEIMERTIEPFMSVNIPFWWENDDSNWVPVCAGSIACAAMLLIDDPSALAPIILKAITLMQQFLDGYGSDGICPEGINYWGYGFGYFCYFAEMLERRTSGAINLLEGEKIRAIARCEEALCLSGGEFANFGDATGDYRYNAGLSHFLRGRFDTPVPDPAFMASVVNYDQCYRFAVMMRALLWTNPEEAGEAPREGRFYHPDSQVFVARKKTGSGGFGFAAKGGHNGVSHNHNDAGNFILCCGKTVFFADIGMGDYAKGYFGSERYDRFNCGSQGHSLPLIGGTAQRAGKGFGAELIKYERGDRRDIFELELAGAYAQDGLRSFKRKFVLDHFADPPKITIVDSFAFDGPPPGVTERFVTFVKPEAQGGEIMLQGRENACFLAYDENAAAFKCAEETYNDYEPGRSRMLYTLDFIIKNPAAEFSAGFEIRLACTV